MLKAIFGAIVGMVAGAGLGFGIYRFYVGAFDIAYMATKGNIYSTDLMVHVALLVGGASGGIIGAIAGATHAIIRALERSNLEAETLGLSRQRL
jgi:hypothetical protein